MGEFDRISALNGSLMPNLDMQAMGAEVRVFVRKMGGQYVELPSVRSFEKIENDSPNGMIAFKLGELPKAFLNELLTSANDKYVDVKMEFSFGTRMKFSGDIEGVLKDRVSITMATPLTTEMMDMPDIEIN